MSSRSVDAKIVNGILFGIYKSLNDIAGDGASAVLRQAAPIILEELDIKEENTSSLSDINILGEKISEAAKKTGLCDKYDLTLQGNKLKANIKNCVLYDLTIQLKNEGIPPFGCPFTALTLAAADKHLGKKGRLLTQIPTPGGNNGDTTLVIELHDK